MEPNNRVSDEKLALRKRKSLLKKLRSIKLNRSRDNNSFYDIKCHYESKLNKLRNNNESLAKALADQRQISQSWYEECVTFKADLHEKDEKLLRFQIMDNGNFEEAVQTETANRIKEVSEPLAIAVQSSIDNVVTLVESLTNIKTLVTSMNRNGRADNLRRSKRSNGSLGCLTLTPRSVKSPRKNVVLPMVDGHVMKPTTINLPRISLEDQRKYRLLARVERRDEDRLDLSSISERSLNNGDPNHSPIADGMEDREEPVAFAIQAPLDDENIQLSPTEDPLAIDEDQTLEAPSSSVESSHLSANLALPVGNEESSESRQTNRSSRPNKKKSPAMSKEEDPLEGPSWFHSRGRKSKKKRCISTLRSMNTVRLVLETFSDDDEEETDEPEEKACYKKKTKRGRPVEIRKLSLSPNKDSLRESRVGRRVKSRRKPASEGDSANAYQELDSFIVTDAISNEPNSKPEGVMDANLPVSTNSSSNVGPVKETNQCHDSTCLINTSMEVTESVSTLMLGAAVQSQNDDENLCAGNLGTAKPLKFFKNNIQENQVGAISFQGSERTPYDFSILEQTYVNKEEKENMPPICEEKGNESMNLKNVSIRIQDCMKSPITSPNKTVNSSTNLDDSFTLNGKEVPRVVLTNCSVRKKEKPVSKSPKKRDKEVMSFPSKSLDNDLLATKGEILDPKGTKRSSSKRLIIPQLEGLKDIKTAITRIKQENDDLFSENGFNGSPSSPNAEFEGFVNDTSSGKRMSLLSENLRSEITFRSSIRSEEIDLLDIPVISNFSEDESPSISKRIVQSLEMIDLPVVVLKRQSISDVTSPPKRRRAAAVKIGSLKEPKLTGKLRQQNDSGRGKQKKKKRKKT